MNIPQFIAYVEFTVMGLESPLPADCLAILVVYKTEAAAREVAGPNAVLVPVEAPDEEDRRRARMPQEARGPET